MNPKLMIPIMALVILVGITTLSLRKTGEDGHHGDNRIAAHEIYPGDAADKITNKSDIILLDIRTPEEYEEIHLKNALLLPVQQLSQQSLQAIGLGEDMKDKEILLYCRSGARSKTAYDIMTSLGYTNIKSVAGGMVHWEEDEYPHTEVGAYAGEVSVSASNVSSSNIGAKISLNRKSHDFGTITQFGGTVEARFTVENTGTEMLTIGQLTTSCSCTSATISSNSIAVGDSATLTVVFDPDFHEEPLGTFKRTVFIPSSDKNTPEAEVSISVDILENE